MSKFDFILKTIKEAKASKKLLNNEEVISILEATKAVAKDDTLINSLLNFQASLKFNNKSKTNVLTSREKEILKLIGNGKLSNTIASELNITISTVETHRKNIRKKLNLNGGEKLFQFALISNIIH